MSKPHDELQLGIHIRNRDVDFRNRDRDSGIDFHQVGNIGVQIDIRAEIIDVKFYATN